MAESTQGIRGFGARGKYAQGVSEISGRYKKFIFIPVFQEELSNQCKGAQGRK